MPEFLVPLALVAAALFLAPRKRLARHEGASWPVLAALAVLLLLGLRYLHWRLTSTLPGPDTGFGETVFALVLLGIELLVWVDTALFFLLLARRRDNTADADRHEARLRATPDRDLPTVDVFIATYNEDLEVLEKTIVGAMALDWPRDRLKVYVLDDGRRDWLRDLCAAKGAIHMTREDNRHAKAGNINAAIPRTSGEFFLVLDADFIPQQNLLYRTVGFFEDGKIGIVQVPHSFYNADPMQKNLNMQHSMPDDQRLFFGSIMAGRDGWDLAFCCGSNSITRRTAIEAVGGGLPTGSITEDMLLSLVMLRKGFVTRYLNEKLAIGLAPESLAAMYVQRARWARGAVQMLFLKSGPLGPGLRPMQRLMFLPLHWFLQPLKVVSTLSVPTICLWTGWSPFPGTTPVELVTYQFPFLLALLGLLRLMAPDGFFPLANTVHAALQAHRLIPTVWLTVLKPHGHAFKVTPKGKAASGRAVDGSMVYAPAVMIFVTALGFAANANYNTQILTNANQLPLLAIWAILSMLVLSLVQAVAVSPAARNADERFELDWPCRIAPRRGLEVPARILSLSLSEAVLQPAEVDQIGANTRWIKLDLPEVGPVAAHVDRIAGGRVEVSFELTEGAARDSLIRTLFTTGLENTTHVGSGAQVTGALLSRIMFRRPEEAARVPFSERVQPAWLKLALSEG